MGVHGDGVVGLEPEGVGSPAGAGGAPARPRAPSREALAVADGVRHVSRGGDRAAVPDRAGWPSVDLPIVVVESVAGDVPAVGGAVAGLLVVLREGSAEVGVRMPRSVWAFERREGVGDGEASWGQSDGGWDLRAVEGTC